MPITAASIIDSATKDLQDAANGRWSRTDMLAWLNDGQREVCIHRPDASVSIQDVALAAGWMQAIPSAATRIIEIAANTSGRSVTLVQAEDLDRQRMNWRADAPAALIKAWIYDERFPKAFQVYPPATTSASLKMVLAVPPAECATEAANITIEDQYKGPLVTYVLHRCYRRDAEDSANAAMASMYYNLFLQQLGVKTQTDMAIRPASAAAQRKEPNQ